MTNPPRITSGRSGALRLRLGRLKQRDRSYGLPVDCYVCGTTHAASRLVRIDFDGSATDVPLCEVCLADRDDERLLRKFMGAPVILEIDEEKMRQRLEQVIALADKRDTTEH